MNRLSSWFAVCLIFAFGVPPAAPAAEYPSQPVMVVVAFTAGGTTDLLARIVANRLTEKLGKPFVIEHKPGAGGNIGSEYTVKAKPDGYTVTVNSVGQTVINPMLFKNLPFDPVADLDPVVLIADVPSVLVVPANANTPTIKALVEKGKTKKGGLSYSSTGIGTAAHLSGFMLAQASNVAAVHIPYKGADALNDLLAGRNDFMFATTPSVMAHIQSGKLVPIAVTSPKRSRSMPDVPTMAESGFPDFAGGSWYGFFAPRGTPRAIVDKLNQAVNDVIREPAVEKQMVALGADPVGGTPEEFRSFIDKEFKKWQPVVRDSGATAQ